MEKNNKYGELFHHYGDATLLQYVIQDLAEHLGHSLEEPLSLYLVCLDLGMPVEICDQIYIEILRIFKNGDEAKLKDYKDIKKIMIKHFPESKNFTELSIKGFIKAIAKNRIPELANLIE